MTTTLETERTAEMTQTLNQGEIARSYQGMNGESQTRKIAQLAEEYHTSRYQVRKALLGTAIKVNGITDEKKREILNKYNVNGVSVTKLAKELSISESKFYDVLREFENKGYQVNRRGSPIKRKTEEPRELEASQLENLSEIENSPAEIIPAQPQLEATVQKPSRLSRFVRGFNRLIESEPFSGAVMGAKAGLYGALVTASTIASYIATSNILDN